MSILEESFTSRIQRRYRFQSVAIAQRSLDAESPGATIVMEIYKGHIILSEEDGEKWRVRIRDSQFASSLGDANLAIAAAKHFIDSYQE